MLKIVLSISAGATFLALVAMMWIYPDVPTASYTLGGLLVGLLAGLVYANHRELREAVKRRSFRYGANALLGVGLVLAIVFVLNFLNYNHYWRKDLTAKKTESLSDQAIKVIADLKQDIKLTIFAKSEERTTIKNMLDIYLKASKKLSVEFVDPDLERERTRAANVTQYGVIVVSSGKREARITELTEEKLVNAVLKVSKEGAVRVCFVTGHGEPNIDGLDPGSLNILRDTLSNQNYEAKPVNLMIEAKVPVECSILAIIDPHTAVTAREISMLRDWLDNGGRMLLAVDPHPESTIDGGAEFRKIAGDWGIQMPRNFLLDRVEVRGVGLGGVIGAMFNPDHVLSKSFQGSTLMLATSSLELPATTPANPNLKANWLIRSSPNTIMKKDIKALASGNQKNPFATKDGDGPFNLIAAAEGSRGTIKKDRISKILVYGSSVMFRNQFVRFGNNVDFITNSLSWLADDNDLISIRPREESFEAPTVSQIHFAVVSYLCLVIIPLGIAVLGGYVWWRRRRL